MKKMLIWVLLCLYVPFIISVDKECLICIDIKDSSQFPLLSCGHSGVCATCIITNAIKGLYGNRPDQVKCLQCNQKLSDNNIRAIFTDTVLRAIQDDDVQHKLQALRERTQQQAFFDIYKTLTAPRPNIGEERPCRETHGDSLENFTFCLSHKFLSKKCPHCGTAVEKSEGCSHMACPTCRGVFCWQCGQDYRRNGHVGGPWACNGLEVRDNLGNLLLSRCSICKKPMNDPNTVFKLHDNLHVFDAHSVHKKCLLQWLECGEDGILPYRPDEIKISVNTVDGDVEIPSLFPCPQCGCKLHMSLSDDERSLIFKDPHLVEVNRRNQEGFGETGIYRYDGPRQNDQGYALPLAVPAPELNFFLAPDQFVRSLKGVQRLFNSRDKEVAENLYRAGYNRLNQLYGKTNAVTCNDEKAKRQVQKYFGDDFAVFFTEEQADTYARLLYRSIIENEVAHGQGKGNYSEFFEQVARQILLPLGQQKQLEFLNVLSQAMNSSNPLWPVISLLTQIDDTIYAMSIMGGAEAYYGQFLRDLKTRYDEETQDTQEAVADLSASLNAISKKIRARR